jgi:hypothetical protein
VQPSPEYLAVVKVLTKADLLASAATVTNSPIALTQAEAGSTREQVIDTAKLEDWRHHLKGETHIRDFNGQKAEGEGWRYLHPGTDGLPAKYCWENNVPTAANAAAAVVSNKKLVILCGDGEGSIGGHRDLTMNKQLYAQRHGFKFVYKLSARVARFWPHDFLSYKRHTGNNGAAALHVSGLQV